MVEVVETRRILAIIVAIRREQGVVRVFLDARVRCFRVESLALRMRHGLGDKDIHLSLDHGRLAGGFDGSRAPRGHEMVVIVGCGPRRGREDPAGGHGEDAEDQEDEGEGACCGGDETLSRRGKVVGERTCHESSQSVRNRYV